MIASRKDLFAGALFVAFGFLYGYQSITAMPIGNVTRMGPGFFPLVLSAILVLIGCGVALRGLLAGGPVSTQSIPWRPILLISISTIIFAIFADELGMLPATFLTVSIAALAKSGTKVWQALLLGLLIALFCSFLFTFGLGLPLPILGSLFSN